MMALNLLHLQERRVDSFAHSTERKVEARAQQGHERQLQNWAGSSRPLLFPTSHCPLPPCPPEG